MLQVYELLKDELVGAATMLYNHQLTKAEKSALVYSLEIGATIFLSNMFSPVFHYVLEFT